MHYNRVLKHGSPHINLKQIAKEKFLSSTCSVNGCSNPLKQNNFCGKHYYRWYTYGDPLFTKTAPTGAGEQFILDHLDHNNDDCLIWPYGRNEHGYPVTTFRGKKGRACQFMCTLLHGDRPSPKHGTLHSCGNGHLGCINPNHLRWGTQKENVADMVAHGNATNGERQPNSKLTTEDVLEIRRLKGIYTGRKLAKIFGVSHSHIFDIQNRKKWKHIT